MNGSTPDGLLVVTYLLYLAISVSLTVWVAHTLFKNGRVFLVRVFEGDEGLADSVNHLLVVGFYLINLGYISLALKTTESVGSAAGVLEALSSKVGVVLVVLGVMHFGNLYAFQRKRRQPIPPPPYPYPYPAGTGLGPPASAG